MDSGFIYGILLMLVAVIACVALFAAIVTWRKSGGDKAKTGKAAVLGGVGGILIFIFVIFPDIGVNLLRPVLAPGFEVEVPQGFKGQVYIYLEDEKPRTRLGWDLNYHLVLDQAGKAVVNVSTNAFIDRLDFEFRYPDGTLVPWYFHGGSSERLNIINLGE